MAENSSFDGFAPRFRYGSIVPTHDVDVDRGPGYQFYRLVPLDILQITASLGLCEYTRDGVVQAMRGFVKCAERLAAERVDRVVLAGIPICAQLGRSATLGCLRDAERVAGVPSDASLEAIVAAMQRLGASRLAVGSRWAPEMNDLICAYLGSAGIDVVAITERGQWAKQAFGMSFDEGVSAALEVGREAGIRGRQAADAILVAGGAAPTLHTIPLLESEFSKPVLTNLSTEVWNGLVRPGVIPPPRGWGNSAERAMTEDLTPVRSLVAPENVVIVGASDRPGSWSRAAFDNLTAHGFAGPVHFVNPGRKELFGRPCYPAIGDVPEVPDHLVVAVPADGVVTVLREGGAAGARTATVYAAGLGESEADSGAAEALRANLRATGVRVCGPNCMGNISAPTGFVTLTTPVGFPLAAGPVAILGQSGGIMMFLHGSLRSRAVGVSYGLSTGNELDLNTADYIRHFADDPDITVVACFIEAIQVLDDFLDACDRASQTGTSVLVVKMGRSDEGRAAAGAHTGSLTGRLDAFDAAIRDHGVIRFDTLEELVEAVEFLAHAKRPRTDRAAAITYSGGLRGLLLEAADRLGYEFPSLTAQTVGRLRELLPNVLISNPLDSAFVGITDPVAYFECVRTLLDDPNVDVVLAQERIPRHATNTHSHIYLKGLEEIASRNGGKPIAVFAMLPEGLTEYSMAIRNDFGHLPLLYTVEGAISTARAVALSRTRPLLPGNPPRLSFPHGGAGVTKNEAESKTLLARYGIPVLPHAVAGSPDEAVELAEGIGYPVVVKGLAVDIPHKSDLGLVRTGLLDSRGVAEAAQRIWTTLQQHSTDVSLSLMVTPHVGAGIETILGVERDAEVGPVVMFGWGGIMVDLVGDVSFVRPPISRYDAAEIVGRTRVSRLLKGYRGGPAYDEQALLEAIQALGQLAVAETAVRSVDVNPFMVLEAGQGAVALDALVVLADDEVSS